MPRLYSPRLHPHMSPPGYCFRIYPVPGGYRVTFPGRSSELRISGSYFYAERFACHYYNLFIRPRAARKAA